MHAYGSTYLHMHVDMYTNDNIDGSCKCMKSWKEKACMAANEITQGTPSQKSKFECCV